MAGPVGASEPPQWRPAGRRHGLVAAVAVHLLVLWLVWRGIGHRVGGAPEVFHREPVVVRLLADERVSTPRTRESPFRPSAPMRPRAIASRPPAPSIEPPGLAPPADATTHDAPSAAPAPTPPTPAANPPPAPPPLDLRLPPPASLPKTIQQQAIDDVRSNSRHQTFTDRMTADLSQDETTEVLADGSVRHRRGANCSIEHPSRAGQLFPMDDAARRSPPGWGPCP